MKQSLLIPILILCVGVVTILIGYVQLDQDKSVATVPEGWRFTLPDGDPAVGRELFVQMQCSLCHNRNMSDLEIPSDTEWTGPNLASGYDRLPKEYLAESIIRVHSVVADPNFTVDEEQEGMGQYNHRMTIEQLTDLVAFLRQPPELMTSK